MANRNMGNRIYSFERDRKMVNARVTIGAAGAPTLDTANSKGVLSIARNSAGDYTITFGASLNGVNAVDVYNKFLQMSVVVQNATGVPITAGYGIKAITLSAGTIEFVMQGPTAAGITAPIPTDPADGDVLWLEFEFGDSTGG